MLQDLYKTSLGLLTDLYQITMAYGYWKSNMHHQETVFHLFFRKAPFQGGYAIATGMETVTELITHLHFSDTDIAYLATLQGNDQQPLFETAFLDYLANLSFDVDVAGVQEGNLVFAHEPILRISGKIIPCQLIETALLTCVNFQTLIATKASRVCHAAENDTVLEFGLRRAQGFDGGISACRAAFIGGAHATSNVLAGKLLQIPVKGTHAHSWVMMFDTEMEAFQTYAEAMPNNCVFLVDTYDTIEGVTNAIAVAKQLRTQGKEIMGIRLDSGDIAELSKKARQLLDDAGFTQAKIVASDSLNEYRIQELKKQGAHVDIWGVGTNLVTSEDQPALGGVYKLAAVRQTPGSPWKAKVKLSNSPIKISNPGILQIRRFWNTEQTMVCDVMYDMEQGIHTEEIFDLHGNLVSVDLHTCSYADLLQPLIQAGTRLHAPTHISDIREFSMKQQERLPEAYKQYTVSDAFPVYLDQYVWKQKQQLITQHRHNS